MVVVVVAWGVGREVGGGHMEEGARWWQCS